MRQAARSLLYSLLSASVLLGAAFASAPDDYPHLRMGVPSEATEDKANKNDFLIKKPFYALSYNNSRGTPNWVSWRLTKDDLGKAPRKRVFDPDEDLPAGFKRIVTKDYAGSGFDRGHMCPHSDRTKTKESSFATFVMTNIVPQSAENNQRAWNQLEMYLRDLVGDEDKVCYIVAGPQGKGGTGKNGFKTTIARGEVTVPARTWKVVMVLDEDVDDPAAIGDEPFRVFHWKGRHGPLTSEELLKITKQGPDTPVEEIGLDDFFGELTEEQGLDEEDARKFQNLRKVIEEQLTDVRVFRVGEVKIDVYIVGKTKDGDWAGVKTSSVET